MKYAIVKFLSSRDEGYSRGYSYENKVGAKVYDAVIVPTRYGLSLAVVTELTDDVETMDKYNYSYGSCSTSIKAVAEIVKSKLVAKEMLAEKKKDLKKKLNAKVKKMDEIKVFEAYAGEDAEFAELLKEYKAL